MLMSAIEGLKYAPSYPELAGKRILITGLTASLGVDIARAFADARCRLVLQVDELTDELQAVAEILAAAAPDVKLFTGAPATSEAAVVIARNAMTAFGGVDAVINLRAARRRSIATATSAEAIDTGSRSRLTMACLGGKIAARSHAPDDDRRSRSQRRDAAAPANEIRSCVRVRREGRTDGDDARRRRGMDRTRRALQCDRAAMRGRRGRAGTRR